MQPIVYTTYLSTSETCTVNQVFGDAHRGTDITFNPSQWSAIHFPKAGVVTVSQNGGSGDLWTYGEWYEVECDDGTRYRLAHLLAGSRAVAVGERVNAGQFAATQGSTGQSTGIHLHIEYFVNGVLTSPYPLMGFPDAIGYYVLQFGGDDPDPPVPPPLNKRKQITTFYNRRRDIINGKRF